MRRLLVFILMGVMVVLIGSCRTGGGGTQGAPPGAGGPSPDAPQSSPQGSSPTNPQDDQLTTIGNPVETPTPEPPGTVHALPTLVTLTSDVESTSAALSSRAALAVSDRGRDCREGRNCLTTSYAWGIRSFALLQCLDGASNPFDCPPEETGREIVLPPGGLLDDSSFVLREGGAEVQFFHVAPGGAEVADLLGNIGRPATRPITVAGVSSGFQIKADFILGELPADRPVDADFALLCFNENGCHALSGYPPLFTFPVGAATQKGDFLFLRLSDSSWHFFDKERDRLVPVTARPAQPHRQELPPWPVGPGGDFTYNASFGGLPSIVVDQTRLEGGQTLRFKAVFSTRGALSWRDNDGDGRIGLIEFETIEFGKPQIVNFEAVFE